MVDRPILFSAPMVRALLAGTKTQTRRVCKSQPYANGHHFDGRDILCHNDYLPPSALLMDVKIGKDRFAVSEVEGDLLLQCPYGQPGDRLWVRETFAKIDGQTQPWIETDYKATYTHGDRLGDTLGIRKRWTPSIHMPRAASRITLEVTGVRVERLQDISEADARAEGSPCVDEVSGREVLFPDASKCGTFKLGYRCVWEQINGPGSWDGNPWVWAVEFKRVT